jgi:hypothetical protein
MPARDTHVSKPIVAAPEQDALPDGASEQINVSTAGPNDRQRSDRSIPRLVVEAMLILLSVAVGFIAAEFGDYREDRRLARFVLQNILSEVESNAQALDSLVIQHRAWQAALASPAATEAGQSGFDVMFALRPAEDVTIGLPLKQAAWNTAVSTGALRLLEYDVAAALSEIYAYQTLMSENHNRLVGTALYNAGTFNPATRAESVRLLWGVMAEVAGNEQTLLALYGKHLPLLRQAIGA